MLNAAGASFRRVLGDRLGAIVPQHEIFDYECKYTADDDGSSHRSARSFARRLQELALATHRTLKLRDFSRTDLRLDERGSPRCSKRTPPRPDPDEPAAAVAGSGIDFDAL